MAVDCQDFSNHGRGIALNDSTRFLEKRADVSARCPRMAFKKKTGESKGYMAGWQWGTMTGGGVPRGEPICGLNKRIGEAVEREVRRGSGGHG